MDEIVIFRGNTTATVVPERGALVSELNVHGKAVFYLDRETLVNPLKSVRGGIPVLFPFAGKLDDDVFLPAQTKISQHGFGRNREWKLIERSNHDLTVQLCSDEDTQALFPYAFIAEQKTTALESGLLVELNVRNVGRTPMPLSPGWHPYFNCLADRKGAVTSDVPGLAGRLDETAFDFGLVAPQSGKAHFDVPGLGRLILSYDPTMRHLQFWTQPGKPFICMEPFWGGNNTINTDKRATIAPGSEQQFWMKVELAMP